MNRARLAVFSLFLAACGGPAPLPDAGVEADAGLSEDAGTDAGTGRVLSLVSGGTTRTVDLSTLATVTLGVKTVVRLDAVVHATFPELEGTGFKVSFKAADGFDPASKANCAALLPLAEGLLPKGGVDPATRNLAWDDTLGYPGCMYVHDCTTLTLAP